MLILLLSYTRRRHLMISSCCFLFILQSDNFGPLTANAGGPWRGLVTCNQSLTMWDLIVFPADCCHWPFLLIFLSIRYNIKLNYFQPEIYLVQGSRSSRVSFSQCFFLLLRDKNRWDLFFSCIGPHQKWRCRYWQMHRGGEFGSGIYQIEKKVISFDKFVVFSWLIDWLILLFNIT